MAYNLKVTKGNFLRGLVATGAYTLRPQLMSPVSHVIELAKNVDPGKETPYSVSVSGLRPNSDVSAIRATVTVTLRQSEVAPVQSEVGVTDAEGTRQYSLSSSASVVAENLAIKLEGGEVFWRLPSSQQSRVHDVPDFSEQVNAYLDRVVADDDTVPLNFIVTSEAPVSIIISVHDFRASNIYTQVWKNELDESFRQDRNLELGYGETQVNDDLLLDELPANTTLEQIELDIYGKFDTPRILGPVVQHSGHFFSQVSKDFSLAQRFTAPFPTTVLGVSLALAVEQEAEIFVAIHDDVGTPGESAIASSTLAVNAPEHEGLAWSWVLFESPTDMSADGIYWIVIKGIRGQVQVAVGEQNWQQLGELRINRGGRLWQAVSSDPANGALVRPIYEPGADNQTAALEIKVFKEQKLLAAQKVDITGDPVRVSLPIGVSVRQARLVIESSGGGSATLANVVQRYLDGLFINAAKVLTQRQVSK